VSAGVADRIWPDYRKPVERVYQELLVAEMVATDRADLLSECFMPKDSKDSSTPTPTWRPSWVPNWAVKRGWNLYMTQQCADGQSTVAAFCQNPGTLHIMGVLVATIVDVLEFPSLLIDMLEDKNDKLAEQPRQIPPVVALIKEIAEKLDLSDTAHYRPSPGCTVLEALCYALSGGGHLKDHLPVEMTNTFTPSMAQFKRLVKLRSNLRTMARLLDNPTQT